MKVISYQAIFLDEDSIKRLIDSQREELPKIARNMHCTFKFNPGEGEIDAFARTVLGKKITLRIVGYASNGKNSGFQVELGPELEAVYTNSHSVNTDGIPKVEKTVPHITVSMSKDAKAVDTGLLDFKPIAEPFEVSGIGGFFVKDIDKKTSSVEFDDVRDKKEDQIEIDSIFKGDN